MVDVFIIFSYAAKYYYNSTILVIEEKINATVLEFILLHYNHHLKCDNINFSFSKNTSKMLLKLVAKSASTFGHVPDYLSQVYMIWCRVMFINKTGITN